MPTIFPSLDAYKVARKGLVPVRADQDPLARYVGELGPWTTGAIQDGDKPLPVVIEISDRVQARKLAEKGGRPLGQSDPEIIEMLRDFYAGKEAPPVVAAVLKPAPAPAGKR